MTKVLYRYEDVPSGERVSIELVIFRVIKETPCGWWYVEPWMLAGMNDEFIKRHRRWVSKTGLRRRCYETRELAWNSFRIRKFRQSQHIEMQRAQVAKVIELADGFGNTPPSVAEMHSLCGRLSIEGFDFIDM